MQSVTTGHMRWGPLTLSTTNQNKSSCDSLTFLRPAGDSCVLFFECELCNTKFLLCPRSERLFGTDLCCPPKFLWLTIVSFVVLVGGWHNLPILLLLPWKIPHASLLCCHCHVDKRCLLFCSKAEAVLLHFIEPDAGSQLLSSSSTLLLILWPYGFVSAIHSHILRLNTVVQILQLI